MKVKKSTDPHVQLPKKPIDPPVQLPRVRDGDSKSGIEEFKEFALQTSFQVRCMAGIGTLQWVGNICSQALMENRHYGQSF
jgi:hypothetical protein